MRNLVMILSISSVFVLGCSSEPEASDAGIQPNADASMFETSDDVITTDTSSDASLAEPSAHREVVEACVVRNRPVGTTATCLDTDCAAGDQGRCRVKEDPEEQTEICTYDECSADSDCAMDEVCECGVASDLLVLGPGADENRCVSSNCRTDADCSDAFCKPSPDICGSGKVSGYYCTTSADECLEDSDCGVNKVCSYGSEESRWMCGGADCD